MCGANQNDPPVLGNNSLTVNEGQTVTLTGSDLSATDVDDLAGDLLFTVSNVTNGHFELLGVATTTGDAEGEPVTTSDASSVSETQVQAALENGSIGSPQAMQIDHENLNIHLRTLPDGYYLALVQKKNGMTGRARYRVERAARELVTELFP